MAVHYMRHASKINMANFDILLCEKARRILNMTPRYDESTQSEEQQSVSIEFALRR
jgi:hypothetical protein